MSACGAAARELGTEGIHLDRFLFFCVRNVQYCSSRCGSSCLHAKNAARSQSICDMPPQTSVCNSAKKRSSFWAIIRSSPSNLSRRVMGCNFRISHKLDRAGINIWRTTGLEMPAKSLFLQDNNHGKHALPDANSPQSRSRHDDWNFLLSGPNRPCFKPSSHS